MPHPAELTVHQKSRVLDVAYDDGSAFSLPFEYLRVYSPSAEVKGHGAGQKVLQLGKREVGIPDVEQVGNYAIKLTSSDGHDAGIFSRIICISQSRPLSVAVDIRRAPQLVVCPSNATGMPLIVTAGSPSAITQAWWPLIGQKQRSPFRATATPITVVFDAAAIILPPWVVGSFSRMTPRMGAPLVIMTFKNPSMQIG